jgi:MFS family permease
MTGSALSTRHFYRAVHRFWYPTAMSFFINGVVFGGWAALVPRAIARLGADESTFGLMLLGMGIGAVLAMAFSGRLIARFGAGPLIRVSLAIFLASYIAVSVSSTWGLFVAALLLFGAAGGLMDVAMNAYAADVETHMSWRVMASFHGMWSIGGLVGAAAVGAMLAVASDLTKALILSAVMLVLFLTCQHGLIPLRHREDAKSGPKFAIDRVALVLGILAAICFSAEGAVRDWSSLFLTNEIRTSIERAGWGFAAFSATMALGRFTGDWLRLRFGEQRVIMTSCIVAVLGFAMAILLNDHLLVVAGFALVGFGLSNIVPILISAAGRSHAPGSSIAFVVSFGYAGYLASPPVLGFIAGQSSLATMFLVVAASCVVMALGWLLVERR